MTRGSVVDKHQWRQIDDCCGLETQTTNFVGGWTPSFVCANKSADSSSHEERSLPQHPNVRQNTANSTIVTTNSKAMKKQVAKLNLRAKALSTSPVKLMVGKFRDVSRELQLGGQLYGLRDGLPIVDEPSTAAPR